MRVGVDLLCCNASYSGGVATFAIGVARGLARSVKSPDRVVVFISDQNEAYLKAVLAGVDVDFKRVSQQPSRRYIFGILKYLAWGLRYFKLMYWYDRCFRSRAAREIEVSADVLVVPTTTLGFYALRIPTLLCMHDIQQEYFPEFFSFRERLSRWVTYRLSAWAATLVQVSSEFVKSCLLEKFPFIKAEKIFIAFEGVDFSKFNDQAVTERPSAINDFGNRKFLFYPAQLWPHKNHILLLDALALFREKNGYEFPCVLTGQDYGHWSVISRRLAELQLKEVYYLGRISFEQLLWLYQNCGAVLALGLHESSSLPVREGAVFGKPLICSDIPPNIETREFLELVLVDQHDPSKLALAMESLERDADAFNEEAQANKKRVECFNWDVIAKKYLAVLQQCR